MSRHQSSMSSFFHVNRLEESMSYLEKTAKKLLPILVEVKKRMLPEKKHHENSRQSSIYSMAAEANVLADEFDINSMPKNGIKL
jgi:hypothetical protein